MSLQVWLPLTGDLHNQGLSEITVTNNGATVNDNGKIGKCYQLVSSSSQKITATMSPNITNAVGSLACWVKFNSLPSSSGWFCLAQLGAVGGFAACRLGIYLEYASGINISINGSSTGANYKAYTFTTGIWYHICATYDGTNVKLYINGIKQLDKVASVGSYTTAATTLFIGGTNSYYTNGYFNDVRYYNHALSAKEVEEISKGLILHYKLNDIYSEATTNLCAQLVSGGRTTIVNNTVKNTGENADTYWYIKPKEALEGGATYTLSCYVEGFSSNDNYISWGVGAQSGANSAGAWNMYNGYNEFTFTMPTGLDGSTGNFILDDKNGIRTEIFTISNVQLEKKDHTTGFVNFGQTRTPTIIYDSSGYNNNGVITGNLNIITNSPKYNQCTYFNGTSYILTESGSFSWFNFDKCTISLWIKPTTVPSSWAGTVGIAHNNSSNNKSFVVGNYGGKFTVQSANGGWINIQTSTLPINEWHHCAATLNDTTIKMYFDGELVNTYTLNWGSVTVASDTRVQIGIDLPGSDEIYQGYYTDVRIYTTALTDEQIKELYNTSMSIDSSGNVYAREVIEL